jgi:hypothetical protein
MRVDAGVHGVLGTTCLVGLSLYVFGAIDWGSRGVALFTLLGFVWVLIVLTGLAGSSGAGCNGTTSAPRKALISARARTSIT